jgi:hypothetical protein
MAGVPIVIGREIDFNAVLLFEPRMETSILGVMPQSVVSFVLHVGVVLVVGILWFDWLFGQRDLDFRKTIATPLLVSCLAMAAVAIYQLFVDVTFLNETPYGNLGRASGTLYDANVCGTIAALWIGGAVLWVTVRRPGPVDPAVSVARAAPRHRAAVLALIVAVLWLAVWATGSRTSFGAALIVSGFSLFALLGRRGERRTVRLTTPRALALGAALVVVLAVLASVNLGVVGPVRRLVDMMPGMTPDSPASWSEFAIELWNRNRYGVAAGAIIRRFPFVGVGVGTFHHIAPDYITDLALPPDNAQNWYRHQLAEFGAIGSIGWIVWVIMFAAFVLRRPGRAPQVAWAARGMLIAFAAISLVGMPAQDIVAAITFWTAAFWYTSLADPGVGRTLSGPPNLHPNVGRTLSGPPKLHPLSWAAILAVLIAYVAGTTALARDRLRVPVRALESGAPYSYGFYYPEHDSAGGEYRWARRRAAIVLDAPTDWLLLSVSVNHRDVATNPVDVKVWRDGVRVINATFLTNDPITQYIHIPAGRGRTLLETSVSRVVKPRENGIDDARELGLQVGWTFLTSPDQR